MTNLVEQLNATVAKLAPEEQKEVLHFAEFLAGKKINGTGAVAHNPEDQAAGLAAGTGFIGSLSHLNLDVTLEEIAEARREMWTNFPREFPR